MQPNNTYFGGGVQPQMQQRSPLKGRRLIFIGVGILLLITIALGVVTASRGNSTKASAVSTKMINLISQGNGKDSYSLLSTDAKQAISSTDWVTYVVANKDSLKSNNPKVVYVEKLTDSTQEEGYNIGEKGSIYRVKTIVNTDNETLEAITINRTSL